MAVSASPLTGVDSLSESVSKRLNIFATSPQSLNVSAESYLRQVIDVAQWSEDAGCEGILVYTDNSIVDPWLVAQTILCHTRSLSPLVAVQPIYMHPYSVAKMVTSLAFLHGRRVYLNMVAGGFRNDLLALNDQTPHDDRYKRLIEYTSIIRLLLESDSPVTFQGTFYRIDKLQLKPALPTELRPVIFSSGSSEAGIEAAKAIGATAIKYPEPPDQCAALSFADTSNMGLRVGIIARSSDTEAWNIAYERFPTDRRGQITRNLAARVSDSVWHHRLAEIGAKEPTQGPYWLGPFETSKSNCPYLVGSYETVTNEIVRYGDCGYRTFILDIPPCKEELQHINVVFRAASGLVN